ncbi:SMP-30/gluconolactonase/LRE family protein [Sphingomonas sp. URHD0057]|uniref:SMP-30/gluconolactonase/LRE family protein n=1 Tax=Sphingomonas sp. URHD0057 TaxID=1380389 RepID=UPI0018CC6A53|nr:SMP-30/gluconolactonase/LRE family protein [Sphingomonas sp. URHD0057]
MAEVQCIADVHAVLGEGPVWVTRESALYWLDIKGRKIFRLDGDGRLAEWPTPLRIGSLAPRKSGGFIAGTEDGIALVDPAADRFEIIAKPEEQLPDNRFNDGKVDRRGRFWAGTMDDSERAATGTLYCVAPTGWAAVDSGYKVTNGPAFSPSGDIMYHSDSARQVTYAFDLGADGQAANRRTFLQFGPGDGYPDGMTVDSDGCLWIAFWDGWCIRRFSAAGEWVETVKMPVQRPTSCAFGGPDLDRLYVTSASIDLDQSALEMQPNAGGLFMTVPGARGLADVPYDG